MTEFNQCSHLDTNQAKDEYHRILNAGQSPLDFLLELQNSLQERLATQYPGRTIAPRNLKTKGELVDFLFDNKRAIDDEFQELVHAVAGTNRSAKEQTAIWKKWKSEYETIRNEPIDALTDEEKLELAFEAIDIFHFWNNILLALGLDEQRIFELYYTKNLENINRYNSGY